MSGPFWRALPEGLDISVRATPRGGRDGVDGVATDAAGAQWLSVRVTAVPDNGKANDAIVKVLAAAFDVRRRDVGLVSGASARLKRFKIQGDSVRLSAVAASFLEE